MAYAAVQDAPAATGTEEAPTEVAPAEVAPTFEAAVPAPGALPAERGVAVFRRGPSAGVQVFGTQPFAATASAASVEQLGEQVLEGLLVTGTRVAHTIPAGALGNERPIEIVTERWYSPELGEVQPKEFIPIAEECGLIVSIGDWVLETACAQLVRWRTQGLDGLRLSVNVSSRQFMSSDVLRTVTDILRRTRVDPHALELEVTERLMLGGDEETALVLRDLRAIGVTIALDDFGTGYSSLSSITRYPLDVLKIDRSIAAQVEADPAAESIVSAIVTLARSLGLGVVAEGVDSPGQARVLARLGCEELQGFLVTPALDPRSLAAFCRDWRGIRECGESDPSEVR